MDGASWPARWPPTAPPAAPVPPLPSQMDGVALRHLLRPFAAQEAAAGGRATATPEQLLTNPSTSQSGQPARAGPSHQLLAQVLGSYSAFGLAPDLKALFDKPNASNAIDIIDLTGAPLPGSTATLPKYPRHGLTASSSNEQSSAGALFLNKSANGMGTFTVEGSANKAPSGSEENRRKHGGFSSRGKKSRARVWNEGIGENHSRGNAPTPVLLEETKNELRPQGNLSRSALVR
ncbi:unnamed protein product [Urochloa humidicola]